MSLDDEGRKLLVTVEPLRTLPPSAKDELAAEGERIASFRGAETADLRRSDDADAADVCATRRAALQGAAQVGDEILRRLDTA